MMGIGEEERLDEWEVPDAAAMEGPIHFGLCGRRWCNDFLDHNPAIKFRLRSENGVGCTDCSGCSMEKATWAVGKKRLLYIPVEFARDVSLQSLKARTTQEQVGGYIRRQYEHAVCFVTTGVHDQALPRKYVNASVWKRHMKSFVKDELLGGVGCKVVVGISLTAVLGQKKFPQTNEVGKLLNGQLLELENEAFVEGWGSQGR